MQPKAGNLTTAQNQMEIPLENLKRTTCSTKHAVAKGLSRIRMKQTSFTVKARKEGGRTLSKMPWPAKKANSNFMHNQLLSPLLNIFSTNPSRMHAFASPSRQQPQNPDYFETTVFGTRAKRHQIS
jgi:hypothetical protein